VAELQFGYIMQLIECVRAGECGEFGPACEAMDQFEADRAEVARHAIWTTGCRSWYLDDRGIPAPWPFHRFRAETAAPKPEAFEARR
jgi:hypothetical protein